MTAQPAEPADDAEAVALWGTTIRGFHATNRKLHAAIRSAFDLNEAETETLLTLHRTPARKARMTKLARAASFTSGGFTKIADRLSDRGLVERVAGREDRRVTYIELTPAGAELAAKLNGFVAARNREYFIGVLGVERARLIADAMRELYRANTEWKT